MKVFDKHYRTIWPRPDIPQIVRIIDQRKLPFEFIIEDLGSTEDVARAIREMHVRGAGLIGATAGYGMYLAAIEAAQSDDFDQSLQASAQKLKQTRPTAVNLGWAVERQVRAIESVPTVDEKIAVAFDIARDIADEDADYCRQIGQHGLKIIKDIAASKTNGPINVLTHCNAGWLAFVDYGTATSPIYAAHDDGIDVHVWVDETRPWNQGARLTAWELGQHGIPHTVITDNAGGYLMQQGLVDLVITGTDRTTFTGDVANKIGTYLKALAARDNDVPFYVALPSSTFDWSIADGIAEIPIEKRPGAEVTTTRGLYKNELIQVQLTPTDSPAANYVFDVTPARLVTALITERGICDANREAILSLFPEKLEH